MKRSHRSIWVAFGFGFLLAMATGSGCSEAASRTLTIVQFQSTETYTGAFQIDTSELPPDAIESETAEMLVDGLRS